MTAEGLTQAVTHVATKCERLERELASLCALAAEDPAATKLESAHQNVNVAALQLRAIEADLNPRAVATYS